MYVAEVCATIRLATSSYQSHSKLFHKMFISAIFLLFYLDSLNSDGVKGVYKKIGLYKKTLYSIREKPYFQVI